MYMALANDNITNTLMHAYIFQAKPESLVYNDIAEQLAIALLLLNVASERSYKTKNFWAEGETVYRNIDA